MQRNINCKPQEPAWKQALMSSPVLTAMPDEKGYLPSHLDGIFPEGREAMMPNGRFYAMFDDGKGNKSKSINR